MDGRAGRTDLIVGHTNFTSLTLQKEKKKNKNGGTFKLCKTAAHWSLSL